MWQLFWYNYIIYRRSVLCQPSNLIGLLIRAGDFFFYFFFYNSLPKNIQKNKNFTNGWTKSINRFKKIRTFIVKLYVLIIHNKIFLPLPFFFLPFTASHLVVHLLAPDQHCSSGNTFPASPECVCRRCIYAELWCGVESVGRNVLFFSSQTVRGATTLGNNYIKKNQTRSCLSFHTYGSFWKDVRWVMLHHQRTDVPLLIIQLMTPLLFSDFRPWISSTSTND